MLSAAAAAFSFKMQRFRSLLSPQRIFLCLAKTNFFFNILENRATNDIFLGASTPKK
jgi:hypothetical protein